MSEHEACPVEAAIEKMGVQSGVPTDPRRLFVSVGFDRLASVPILSKLEFVAQTTPELAELAPGLPVTSDQIFVFSAYRTEGARRVMIQLELAESLMARFSALRAERTDHRV